MKNCLIKNIFENKKYVKMNIVTVVKYIIISLINYLKMDIKIYLL